MRNRRLEGTSSVVRSKKDMIKRGIWRQKRKSEIQEGHDETWDLMAEAQQWGPKSTLWLIRFGEKSLTVKSKKDIMKQKIWRLKPASEVQKVHDKSVYHNFNTFSCDILVNYHIRMILVNLYFIDVTTVLMWYTCKYPYFYSI